MVLKNCDICNKSFNARSKLYKRCSKQCSIANRDKFGKIWYSNNRYRYIKNIISECDICKKEYININHSKRCSKECIKNYRKEIYNKKENNKLINTLRARTCMAITKGFKNTKTIELLGCNINEFKKYLENNFKEGMSWNNHNEKGWHLDHIKPCASFDLSKEEEQKKCFHYSNYQPLWAEENLRKGAR